MNTEDSEQIGLYLQEIGYEPVQSWQQAKVVLLNTCSVRRKPEDKAFSFLGEIALLKRSKPDMIIGVCGCMAQLRREDIRRRAPFVDFVVGTAQISTIPGLVEEAAQGKRFQSRMGLPERKGAVVTDVPRRLLPGASSPASNPIPQKQTSLKDGAHAKLKAFVPIQYGCDKFCTFCIVPTTRGRERSRPTEDIVGEVRALASLGTKEVTLLGQTVNSYGKNLAEGRVPFSKLLRLLDGIPGLERIRYTSPYPRDFKGDLIEAIRDCPKVMEHCHMPLQSGDNDVLKSMKRLYTIESYSEIVSLLRAQVPGLGLTTDIIVGFPGETEDQFERTLEAIETIRFDGAYMFIYSPRPGTPASEMGQVPLPIKKARMLRLAELQNRITCEINSSLVGKTFEVLVEGLSPKNPQMLQGYSREFKMMHFAGPAELAGRLVQVEATEGHLWGLSGRLA